MNKDNQKAISLPGEGDAYWTGFLNIIRLSGEETGLEIIPPEKQS